MAEPEPDWYPDPAKTPGVFRWWTGAEWTDLLASDPDAPPPADGAVTRTVGPDKGTSTGHAIRNTLVVAAAIAAVLTLFTVLGFQSGAQAERYPEGQPTDFGTPKVVSAPAEYDESTRQATLRGQLTMTMPGDPYSDPFVSKLGNELFTASVSQDTVVHEESATSKGWWGSALFGLVNPSLVTEGDLSATAGAVLDQVSRQLYDGQPVETSDLAPVADVPDGFTGYTGRVSYDVKGIPSTHDNVVIVLVELADGEVGVWLEVLPNDRPAEAQSVLEEARGTLAVK